MPKPYRSRKRGSQIDCGLFWARRLGLAGGLLVLLQIWANYSDLYCRVYVVYHFRRFLEILLAQRRIVRTIALVGFCLLVVGFTGSPQFHRAFDGVLLHGPSRLMGIWWACTDDLQRSPCALSIWAPHCPSSSDADSCPIHNFR